MEDNEDLDFVAEEHDKLINAVSKLDKTQHITAPTRNEPTNLNSEFNLIKRSNKVNLLKAVKLLEDTANHVQISKKLKSTQNQSLVLSKPLEKPQAERIKRETGYVEAKKKIGKWDAVVARSRTIDCVTFPLQTLQTKDKKPPTGNFLSKLKLKSPLEKELEEGDPPVQAEEEDEDDEKSFPMTYQEMLEHRQHLAKLRAKESYKAAKAKRQSKIKSKKYHRILKKERLKQQLKEFEELQVKNPEEALKKLEELEKVRALERHTLRHKNTGKWAKSKLVRAKYDKEVRQQLAEQLSVSRSLTHKTQDTASTDDEADNNEVIPDLTLSQDPLNPWMMKRSDKSNINEEFNFGYKKYLKEKMYKRKHSSDSESESENINETKNPDTEDDKLLNILKGSISKMGTKDEVDEVKVGLNKENKNVSSNTKNARKRKKQKPNKPVSTTTWIVDNVSNKADDLKVYVDISEAFDSYEGKVAKQVEEKLCKLRKEIDKLQSTRSPRNNTKKRKAPTDNVEYLKFKNQKIKAIIDEELIETNSKTPDEQNEKSIENYVKDLQAVPIGKEEEKIKSDIDPNKFIEVKPKYLNTSLSKEEHQIDQLDDDDEQVVPKVDIEEVFEEDDVVASFKQEKEDEINKEKSEEIVLNLPGWGSWGGKGVKPPKRKRNRFIAKPAPTVPRRDENKGDVIIIETKDPVLNVHKVKEVPFPFNSVKDYEASIRAPLGNTFIPETAHKKLIKPGVITKSGSIIEPMTEEELLMPKNKSFHNKAVLKLLAKK